MPTFEVLGEYRVIGLHPGSKIDIFRVSCLVHLWAEEPTSIQEPPLFKMTAIRTHNAKWEEGVDCHHPITSLEVEEFLKDKGVEFPEWTSKEFLKEKNIEFLEQKVIEFLKEKGAFPRYEPKATVVDISLEETENRLNESIAQFKLDQHENFEEFYAGEYKKIIAEEYKVVVTGEYKEFITEEYKGIITGKHKGIITEEYKQIITRKYKEIIAKDSKLHANNISLPSSSRKRGRSLAFINDSSPTSGTERKHSDFYKVVHVNLSEMFSSFARFFV